MNDTLYQTVRKMRGLLLHTDSAKWQDAVDEGCMEAKNKFDTYLSGEHRWDNQLEKPWTSPRTFSCNWQANNYFLNVAKIVDFGGKGYLMLFVRVEKRRVQTNNKAHCLLTTKNIRITKTS